MKLDGGSVQGKNKARGEGKEVGGVAWPSLFDLTGGRGTLAKSLRLTGAGRRGALAKSL